MTLTQHNHPVSGLRYSHKQIAQRDTVRTGSGFQNGEGRFDIQLGLSVLSDDKTNRTVSLEVNESEAKQLIARMQLFLTWCDEQRAKRT